MPTQKRTYYANIADSSVHANTVSTTVAFALSKSMTMEQVKNITGLSELDIVNSDARVSDDVLPKLWHALTKRHPGQPLAIEMARAAPFSFFAGLADGAQFAETLREALMLLIQNQTLVADRAHLELLHLKNETILTASHPLDNVDRGRTSEFAMALTTRLIREILGVTNSIIRVELAFPAVGPQQAYQDMFEVPVTFEQKRSALIFDPESMKEPVSQSNLELFSFVKQHFNQTLSQIKQDNYPIELEAVRKSIIENAILGEFSAAAVASRLHTSLRSLQRHVKTHGVKLQELIEEVRVTSAKEFLSDPKISIESIALLTGYSDSRAFRRAFKRWTDKSPSEFRRLLIE